MKGTAMTQTSNRFADQFARLFNDAAGVADGVRREAETLFRTRAERFFNGMDLVKREDFDAVREMASKAREENARLEARIQVRSASFGRIHHGATSAFLLDFGSVLAIEFSQPGNACYCFSRQLADEVVPDFWSQESFNLFDFKRTDLVPSLNWENLETRVLSRGFRFAHHSTWEEKATRQLATMGIRRR